MQTFWKIMVAGVLSLVGYRLYKKYGTPSDKTGMTESQDSNNATSQKETKKESNDRIIERLTKIDGVTSRVAENLVEKKIYTREELTALSEDELRNIKGIGPKRAAKILNLD